MEWGWNGAVVVAALVDGVMAAVAGVLGVELGAWG